MSTSYVTGDDTTSQVVPLSLNSEQATELIIERARQLVNQLVEDRGHEKPPFLPEEFAQLQGIKKIVKAELGKVSAVLLRFHDGYVIKVNQNHSMARQNFSCAHEIGHTLFSELKLERYIKNIEYRTFNPQACARVRAAARERLCDTAATELLMPEFVFRKYLSGFGVSVVAVRRLASIFNVSITATAIRVAELSTEPCIAILWKQTIRARTKGLDFAWCAGPGIKPRSGDSYVPVHTHIGPSSALFRACKEDGIVKSNKLFKRNNAVKRLPMESKGFGRNETRYVISLAFPDR